MTMQNNKYPWHASLQYRLNSFHFAGRQGKRRALYLYESPDQGTFRYRLYNVRQVLLNSSRWSMDYFFTEGELSYVKELISDCDLLVLCRTRWSFELEKIIQLAKQLHKPLLFDVDDLIYDLDYLPLITNTLGISTKEDTDYDFWFSYISRIYFTARQADGFITTNDYLANQMEKKFQKPAKVIRNSLNRQQLRTSADAVLGKRTPSEDSPFVLGYSSGSRTHINDFASIAPEITAFLEDHNNARLLVVGHLKFPAYMNKLINRNKIIITEYVPYLELQYLTAGFDVNIVPLLINTFTNCKSELKYFESAITDTITVASPSYTYSKAITHGENGYLCRSGEWYNVLEMLYQQRGQHQHIITSAHSHALETFYGSAVQREIEQCYDFFSV